MSHAAHAMYPNPAVQLNRRPSLLAVRQWLDTREPAEPVDMAVTDEQIRDLERIVRRAKAERLNPTIEEHRLLVGLERAIDQLKADKNELTAARYIITAVWQSRQLIDGDFWAVTNRELDAIACQLAEKFFGEKYTPEHHPHRRRTDPPTSTKE